MSLEFWKFRSMDPKNLISKLLGHIFNHLLHPIIFNRLSIFRDMIKSFECQSGNTILPIFDPTLTVSMYANIFLKFVLILKTISSSLFKQITSSVNFWFRYIANCWILKFFWINIHEDWIQITSSSLENFIISIFLPCSCIFRIGNKLLRHIIILK